MAEAIEASLEAPLEPPAIEDVVLSSREVRSLLEVFKDPAALLSPDLTILSANRAYCGRFGAQADVVGRHCHAVSHHHPAPCDQIGEACPLRAAQEGGEPAHALHVHHTRHGPEHEEVFVAPVHDACGRIVAYYERLRPLESVSARVAPAGLIGASVPFRDAVELASRAAASETTVLLLGETGTGKELFARLVHDLSPRHRANFVPLDCSGLTETLFESELLGHEKGAFTGATHRKRGLVEAASGGTLFLDEVGDIPLALQVKLLRLLESGTYRRVGSPELHRTGFRLVCATHQDLEAKIEAGTFRPDLYYRIAAFPVRVPPLRERIDDLPLLVQSLLQRIAPHRALAMSREALAFLEKQPFPGNVRELLNILERAALLAEGEVIRVEHVARSVTTRVGGAVAPNGRLPTLEEHEQSYLLWALRQHGTDKRALAQALGVSERTLYRKLSGLRSSHT